MLFKIISYHIIVIVYILCVKLTTAKSPYNSSFTPEHLRYLKNETKELFKHAWNSYMEFGFPFDEVRPLTCEPYGPDYKDYSNTVRNDAMANISSTILDNLDTLIIMEQWNELDYVLEYLNTNQNNFFDKNSIVQVFETTIRFLGGLMSAHLILTDVKFKPRQTNNTKFMKILKNYDGFLLKMAHDLGLRLITSYRTSTNIPVPRINLANGLKSVPPALQKDACTSGVTTPVLEFTLLSKLTGDYQFEYFSQMSFWKLWSSKSPLNLMPMTIDPVSNQWKDSITGIGASIDSFYEYAAKSSILFDDKYMWSVFTTSYQALLTHSAQGGEGAMIFPNVGTQDGVVFSDWIDSLGAFWSGLQVLTGQLTDAIKTHVVYMKIWNYFDSIPERWIYAHHNKKNKKKKYRAEDSIELEWYPLRPEFIESSYYLYRATKDPMYLQIGERVLNLFQDRFKAPCGFSGIQDINTGEKQNRMETFVMGETLKYLYLLFDTNDEVFLHSSEMNSKNWIFSTEAHPLWFHKGLSEKRYNFGAQNLSSLINESSKFTPAVIKNLTIPTPFIFNIPDENGVISHIGKKDPFSDRFKICELNPLKKSFNSLLESSYYGWPYLFNSDHSFSKSLKKPPHIDKSNLDGSYIELTKDFYDKFTSFDTPLMCPRVHNTQIYEIFWGDIKLCGKTEVSQIVHLQPNITESIILQNDLWVPTLQGLRITFEELALGLVDSRNELITSDYISMIQSDEDEDEEEVKYKKKDSILRIKKINGVPLKYGSVIWTLPFAPNPEDKGAVRVTSESRVVIQGKVIENLLVWYG
ncbi:uncharacterized protein KGF55_001854 [Candida pseudojiufengensis]|uniref:uncharacterized protein n=1 Tax=Candida pseudojiufengensis TaxID=497109 RepID=UPI002224651D|nr:uncharacterized protein KGF55_001854 [Candida pseudojiufengensis]KAI5964784.1 hypothetical protein KGF55_001854 [Candida pseudojiufengensis]